MDEPISFHPTLTGLATEWVRFERAYTQQAICLASRASLFSGYRNNQYKIFNCEAVQKIIPEAQTMNKFFENNGYEVIGVGKLYHHTEDHKEQFGESWFDSHDGFKGVDRGYLLKESVAVLSGKGRGLPWECADVDDSEYMDGYYGEWVSNKLAELKNNDKPFFLGVGFTSLIFLLMLQKNIGIYIITIKSP
jgi:iduronate 2-sulfatase